MSASPDPYHLYFVAIVPDTGLQDKVNEIKRYFGEQYNSHRSLRSPPHITLHMPFRWRKDREEILERTLSNFASSRDSFEVTLDGFGAFRPRVIYINVQQTDPLYSLQKDLSENIRRKLKIVNDSYRNRGFHPHMTIAFRDLSKSNFSKAWKEFEHKNFIEEFTAGSISLLKHNGKTWDIHKTFPYS